MNYSHDTIFVPMNGSIPLEQTILLYIVSLWSLIWKGLALWRASKQSQRNWFIVLLVLNTVGILDIIYLFRYSKNRMTIAEVKEWFKKTFASKKQSK
jgi:hypothetical protein